MLVKCLKCLRYSKFVHSRWRLMIRYVIVLIVVVIMLGAMYLVEFSRSKKVSITQLQTGSNQVDNHQTETVKPSDFKMIEFHHGNLTIINVINKTRDEQVIGRLNIHLDSDLWRPDVEDIADWPLDNISAGNNITGWPHEIVPNIVHYVLFGQRKISYVHMLSIFSVLRIQKPNVVYIHCDCHKMDDDDKNWDRILKFVNATDQIEIQINEVVKPAEIYGKKISAYPNFHAGDITRFRTLRKYGGIYLDNDVFVCQSLNVFRKFEFTLGWEEGQFLGNQVLIGNRNARFLNFTLDSYREYYPDEWYYNAGELPTIAILHKYPQLIHRVRMKFGYEASVTCPYFYTEYHADWQTKFYAFHMLARGDTISWKEPCFGEGDHFMKYAVFNDELMQNINTTFGEMARFVLYGSTNFTQ